MSVTQSRVASGLIERVLTGKRLELKIAALIVLLNTFARVDSSAI